MLTFNDFFATYTYHSKTNLVKKSRNKKKKETPTKCTHMTITDVIPSLPKFQFLLTGVETNFTLWPGGPGKIDFKLDNYITEGD